MNSAYEPERRAVERYRQKPRSNPSTLNKELITLRNTLARLAEPSSKAACRERELALIEDIKRLRRLLLRVMWDAPTFLWLRDELLSLTDICLPSESDRESLARATTEAWPDLMASDIDDPEPLSNFLAATELPSICKRILPLIPDRILLDNKHSRRLGTDRLVRTLAIQYRRKNGKWPTSWPDKGQFVGTFPESVGDLCTVGVLTPQEGSKLIRRFNDTRRPR